MVLTQKYLKSRLRYNKATGVFTWKNGPRAGDRAGCLFSNGYRYISVAGLMIGCHRLACLYVIGVLPPQADHRNGNPGDDRWCNVRPANQSQNKQNARVKATSKSGFKGVTWKDTHGKWAAHIGPRGSVKFLGHFDDPAAAHAAYVRASKTMYGEFARA